MYRSAISNYLLKRNKSTYPYKDLYVKFMAILFIIAKYGKRPKCLSTDISHCGITICWNITKQ